MSFAFETAKTGRTSQTLAQPLCRNVSGIFVVYILKDFAGDFPGGFFWALLPTKMRKSGDKSAQKSGGPKAKIREKSGVPKTGPDKLSEI